MVRIVAPSACNAGTRQLFTSAPFTSTAQAPHSPSPQPSLVPVSLRCSRSASSRRSIGNASNSAAFPLTWQWMRTGRARSGMRAPDHGGEHFGCERNAPDIDAGGVGDGVGDGGRSAVERKFANAFRAAGAAFVENFLEEDPDRRQVHRGGHNVVGHLAV